MKRSLAILVLLAIPASAAPLEMRYLRSENLHIANQGGAMNWHDEVTLKLDLQSNGKLVGTETGRARKHDLHVRGSSSYTSEDLQTWTHRWSGSWKRTGATLALDVVLDDRKCTHTKKDSDGPLEQLACDNVSKTIHFDCTTRDVPLLTPARIQPKADVWQCLPTGNNVDLDRTPTPWTFGKSRCVKMLGGRTGLNYEPC